MRHFRIGRGLRAAVFASLICLPVTSGDAQVACVPGSTTVCVDQGGKWTNATRKDFYSRDQGSQMIPYPWIKALQTADGQPFLGDALARYGYLPDPFRKNMPVGFTIAGSGSKAIFGMTCAACHTRVLSNDGFNYLIDGGPAIVDFQGLLTDMIDAVARVRADDAAFLTFGKAVLDKANPSKKELADLRTKVDIWYERENTLRERAYATPGIWGLGRLDAVSMIFNRLTGMDLGPAPTYLIAGNIQPANAPVRYPFLWNAAIQDTTQWPGFSPNGTAVTALIRNSGEVYGVFGTLHPSAPSIWPGNVNYRDVNSANGDGLLKLERLIRQIGAPKWPAQFPISTGLAKLGAPIYQAQCASCHGQTAGKPGFPNIPTWATPLQDTGTDSLQYEILARTADPGVLSNLRDPFDSSFRLANPSPSFTLLKYAILGSIVQKGTIVPAFLDDLGSSIGSKKGATVDEARKRAFAAFAVKADPGTYKYESRVMYGIWAAAPYLHNGSVATLADLLTPDSQRPTTFKVGPNFDAKRVGLAADQPGSYARTTTGCEARNSGNSHCGHNFGTDLSAADKAALLEYMKTL